MAGDSADRFEEGEGAIAAALRDMADIPPTSHGFSRRCLVAARAVPRAKAFGCGAALRLAAAAAIAAAATWLAAEAFFARQADGAATVEDVSAVGVVAARFSSDGSAAMSNESVVNADPNSTVLWKTLNAGQSQMAWEWPDGAKSARLTITGCGLRAEKIYGTDDAFPVWNPPVPEDFDEGDVYTARLTFYRGARGMGDEIASLVADGIGFVRGVSGAPARIGDASCVRVLVIGAIGK